MHFLQSQVERIIDQCCNSSVLSQPSTVINNNNNGCNLKTAEGLIEHACKPGVQRSGDILNG
ncbi:hypothetical protein TYRP_015971 [Tyrophagus putrescentiae]|nr:hypothetical protein TYRP_015971 [Tyrophagus putrescentiae]